MTREHGPSPPRATPPSLTPLPTQRPPQPAYAPPHSSPLHRCSATSAAPASYLLPPSRAALPCAQHALQSPVPTATYAITSITGTQRSLQPSSHTTAAADHNPALVLGSSQHLTLATRTREGTAVLSCHPAPPYPPQCADPHAEGRRHHPLCSRCQFVAPPLGLLRLGVVSGTLVLLAEHAPEPLGGDGGMFPVVSGWLRLSIRD